jgi:hypothetical protein
MKVLQRGSFQKISDGGVSLRRNFTFLTIFVLWYYGKEGSVTKHYCPGEEETGGR